MIAHFDKTRFDGNRNLTVTPLLWDGMIRIKEGLSLQTSDIDLEGRLIKVFSKGRKERMGPPGVKTLRVLRPYLMKWRSKFPPMGVNLF